MEGQRSDAPGPAPEAQIAGGSGASAWPKAASLGGARQPADVEGAAQRGRGPDQHGRFEGLPRLPVGPRRRSWRKRRRIPVICLGGFGGGSLLEVAFMSMYDLAQERAPSLTGPAPVAPIQRLRSLDIFRGITIAAMLLVNH